jgi:hypothetical protein
MELKSGYSSVNIQMSGAAADALSLTDVGAASSYTAGKAGDEAVLYSGSTAVGAIYYNCGVMAIATGSFLPGGTFAGYIHWSGSHSIDRCVVTGNIDNMVLGLKNHLNNIQFNNVTNLNNSIYFCRALNSEFNYSSNPTFLDGDGRILPCSGTENQTRSYITSVGLYDIQNNLLAVAKLSEPVRKRTW